MDIVAVRCEGDGVERHVTLRLPDTAWELPEGMGCRMHVLENKLVRVSQAATGQ